jgi:hypothetical protein
MLTTAAVCPHPPVIVPAATGGLTSPGDAELAKLRDACDAAVATLAATYPDAIVVVGAGPRTTRYPPDATGTLAGYGVPFTVGTGIPVLPLSLTIGRWILARTGYLPTCLQAVAADEDPDECLALGAEIAALAPRVAVLAMGDGPGRRARNAPGAEDPAADSYDERVAKALAEADPAALAALDPADDKELFVAGRAAWQVLAGAMGRAAFRADLHYAAAPFEVTYFAASMQARAADHPAPLPAFARIDRWHGMP